MGITVYQLLVYSSADDEHKRGAVLCLFIGYRTGFSAGCFTTVDSSGDARKRSATALHRRRRHDNRHQYCFLYDPGIANPGLKSVWSTPDPQFYARSQYSVGAGYSGLHLSVLSDFPAPPVFDKQ